VLFDDEEIIDVVESAVVASQTADPSPEDMAVALNNQEFDKAILVFKEELLQLASRQVQIIIYSVGIFPTGWRELRMI
jgi:hypothetical protein